MVFGPIFGAAVGAAAGFGLGSAIFSQDVPRDYSFITEDADRDENIRVPAVATIDSSMRSLIPLTPEWTTWPDYDRWQMINRLLRLLWPKICTAAITEVVKVVKPILQETFEDLELNGIIEDIKLGPHSLLDAEHLHELEAGKQFTMGLNPVRVAGMKVYHTSEDTCILEVPAMWGSDMDLNISVYLKLGPLKVIVPINVGAIQFKVLSRVVLHLVDPIPCIGGATLSLLDIPHFDMRLRVFGSPDIMALPGVKLITRQVIKYVVTQLLLYPNNVSVPLMPNYGNVDNPKGMLHVRLHKIEGLKSMDIMSKSDPYVVFEVRQGRSQRSKTVRNSNDPIFNEEFFLVVDDFALQSLTLKVYDEDIGIDDYVGSSQVYFSEEYVAVDEETGGQRLAYEPRDFIKTPLLEKALVLPIFQDGAASGGSQLGRLKSLTARSARSVGNLATSALNIGSVSVKEDGRLTLKVAKPFGSIKDEELREELLPQAQERLAAAKAQAAAEAAAKLAAKGPAAIAKASKAEAAAAKKVAEAEAKLAPEKKEKKLKQEANATGSELDKQLVLVDERVEPRGNVTQPPGTKAAGTVFLTITFIPFNQPEYDDDIEQKPAKEGLSQFIPFDPPVPREIVTNVSDYAKGLLTVKVIKCGDLLGPGGGMDPFVELILVDCDPLRPDETQYTTTKYNDDSPRFNEKFDFVMLSAGSTLTINVWNRTGIMDMALSLNLTKSRFQNRLVGKVIIPVSDVVRNGSLRDTWPLQDAERGVIEMKLDWSNCYVEDYLG